MGLALYVSSEPLMREDLTSLWVTSREDLYLHVFVLYDTTMSHYC